MAPIWVIAAVGLLLFEYTLIVMGCTWIFVRWLDYGIPPPVEPPPRKPRPFIRSELTQEQETALIHSSLDWSVVQRIDENLKRLEN